MKHFHIIIHTQDDSGEAESAALAAAQAAKRTFDFESRPGYGCFVEVVVKGDERTIASGVH